MSGTVSNPLIPLAPLNRIRASIVVASYPTLNVTASYLGKRGVSVDFGGEFTQMLDVMTGEIPSPEPFVPLDVRVSLIKTLALSGLWIAQAQLQTNLGNLTVHPDSSAFPDFDIFNASITRINAMAFDGSEPVCDITLRGYYPLNSALWTFS